MPGDPVLLDEVRSWLRKAANDLRTAELARAASPPLQDQTVFHCQQAVEKALKGFLVFHGRTFRKTHSIEEIGEQALAIDDGLRSLVDRAVPLTEYAWRFRYPGEPEDPSAEEAGEALRIARDVFAEIFARLPPAGRP